jgi:integrase
VCNELCGLQPDCVNLVVLSAQNIDSLSELYEENPSRYVTTNPPTIMETQAPEFHTRDEQKALLKATQNVRHRVLILLMLDAGCRVTEARHVNGKIAIFGRER